MKKMLYMAGAWLLVCALLFSACGGNGQQSDSAAPDESASPEQSADPSADEESDASTARPVQTFSVDLAGYSVELGVTRPSELVALGMEISSAAVDGVENVLVEPDGYNWAGTPFDINDAVFLFETFNPGGEPATVMDCPIYSIVWYVDFVEPAAETFIDVEGYSFYYGMPGEQAEIIMDEMNYSGVHTVYDVYEKDGLYYYFQINEEGELGSFRLSLFSGDEVMSYR